MHENAAQGIAEELPEDFDADEAQEASSVDLSAQLSDIRSHNVSVAAREAELQECRDEQVRVQEKIDELKRQLAELSEEELELNQWLIDNPAIDPTPVEAQVAAHDQLKENLGRYRSMQDHADEAQEARELYDALTERIEAIRSTPGELLADVDLPIKGLAWETENGEFLIDGRPLGALSDGEQLRRCGAAHQWAAKGDRH